MTQKEYIGFGSIDSIESELNGFNTQKILIVMEKVSYAASGAQKYIESITSRYQIETFSEFEPNPKLEDLLCGIELFSDFNPSAVIAIGGGSVLDMAKMINFFASNEINPVEYVKSGACFHPQDRTLIAVPTTSGTGSEATHFAVLYIDHVKYSIAENVILPDVAIVDSALTMSLPRQITAATGMDALSQAIESYWCVNSTEESRIYAKQAIQLVIKNLEKAVNSPDEQSRQAMARGAHLAGKAINITKTTAPHAVSYPLTSYFNIPHGHAVGLTLSSFFEYNSQVSDADVLDVRGSDHVKTILDEIVGIFGVEDVCQAKKYLDDLMDAIGLETRIGQLGITTQEHLDIIVNNGFNPDRVKNNPRLLTEDTLRKILSTIQ